MAPRRTFLLTLATLSSISALVGGGGFLLFVQTAESPPIELLAHTPFTTFLIPVLLLMFVVGGTSLAATIAIARRSEAAPDLTILAGGTLTVWIVVEVALLRGVHWLHVVYGLLGVALLGLGIHAALTSGVARHRWVVTVTMFEAIGFVVPATVGVFASWAHASEPAQAALVVGAGLFEGLALGTGQALAFPLPVRQGRYAMWSMIGAGVAWGLAMSIVLLGSEGASTFLLVAWGCVAAIGGLVGLGIAQWLELRHHSTRAEEWVGWSALAWTVALPLAFSPAPLVDEASPLAVHLVLWPCAGLLMAYVMALVTWQGARRLADAPVVHVDESHSNRIVRSA